MPRHQPKLVKANPAMIKSLIPDFENLTTDELIERICVDLDPWIDKITHGDTYRYNVDPDFEDN